MVATITSGALAVAVDAYYLYAYYHGMQQLQTITVLISLDLAVAVLCIELSCIAPPRRLVCRFGRFCKAKRARVYGTRTDLRLWG